MSTTLWKRFFSLALIYLSIAFCFLFHWIKGTFGEPTLEQIFFHLFAGAEGADPNILWDNAKYVLFPALLYTALFFVLVDTPLADRLFRRPGIARTRSGVRRRTPLCALIFFMAVCGYGAWLYDLPEYLENMGSSGENTAYDAEYVPYTPDMVRFAHKKNLVFILAEALEGTYADASVFGENLLPRLSALGSRPWPDHRQVGGTEWTIAGTVAYVCGVPLRFFSNTPRKVQYFLPGAAGLTNVLAENGYAVYTLQGSNEKFSGIGVFWKDHGVPPGHIIGDEEIAARFAATARHRESWAWRDSGVYAVAREIIRGREARKDQPFALLLSTLDTHLDGFLDPSCPKRYGDFRDVALCADRQAADFIAWLMARPGFADTLVVLANDHLAMHNDISERFLTPHADKRRNLSLLLNPARPFPAARRAISHFDLYPTILEALGAEIKGGRLGMGVSLYGSTPTLVEKYGTGLNKALRVYSKRYNSFFLPKDGHPSGASARTF